ncbi:hypothetical protein P8C59_008409 [Phyllachora maydis]|uniref:Uncharacterized protein n=1 Tax=Phyllachora maydis TaxID=1825666 RepID=A0AAD9IBC9_9PEZI|nr:hypothetical protein P8C59_008409 [Phyllachora maydis]
MANPVMQPSSRRRFAPVPIETTFSQYRKGGAAELTPSPSPRSPSPSSPPSSLAPRERHRFAPQLVESSVRRSRRAGDDGPATRPTDKTDITPYTKHIYAPKSKKKGHGGHAAAPAPGPAPGPAPAPAPGPSAAPAPRRVGHARRESCDDEIAGGVFDLVARDAQRKLQEVAMTAFPNSYLRTGGAEHFYVREGSDDDSSSGFGPSRGRTIARGYPEHRLSRRDSSAEDVNWAFKEMQEHALRLGHERLSTLELDNMSIDGPPDDAMALTRSARQSLTGSPLWSRLSGSSLGAMADPHPSLFRPESPLPTIGESAVPLPQAKSSPVVRPSGEHHMPHGLSSHKAHTPATQVSQEMGLRHQGSPFRRFGPPQDGDMSLERARNFHKLRANHTPPMLGKDLSFRMCPSPKQTKLEPDHLFDLKTEKTAAEHNRDLTGQRGLWRGYCYTADKTEQLALVQRPAMLITPFPPATPRAQSQAVFSPTGFLCEEPTRLEGQTRASTQWSVPLPQQPAGPRGSARSHEPKGLHMLRGLEERLRQEKAQADLEVKIVAEFDDKFVTQVYNYLSLGYPAMARQYDDELSKISRISVAELERDDSLAMDHLWGAAVDGQAASMKAPGRRLDATGHIMLDNDALLTTPEEERCPRWKALKLYIFEWARQHPDLEAIGPLPWGMRERRGSWGV